MLTEFAEFILYTQLLLSNPAGLGVGLFWSNDEVAQGFAWDKDTIAFGVPDHDGDCLVSVDTGPETSLVVADDALWAVAVPFTAAGPTMEVGTVLSERPIPIVPGRYQVLFQARPGTTEHAFRLEITFSRNDRPGFAILKQGILETGRVLRKQASRV